MGVGIRDTGGGHGEFPRGSVHHHRAGRLERSAGQKRPLRAQGQFAEIQGPAQVQPLWLPCWAWIGRPQRTAPTVPCRMMIA